jgi:hypothetical protein
LPEREHDLPHWQTAIEVLLLSDESGERRRPDDGARIAMMRAINADRSVSSAPPTARRKRPKKYRIIAK